MCLQLVFAHLWVFLQLQSHLGKFRADPHGLQAGSIFKGPRREIIHHVIHSNRYFSEKSFNTLVVQIYINRYTHVLKE